MPHKRAGKRFRLVVSPITTAMVDVEPMAKLASAADAALRAKGDQFKLDGIVLFPIVTDPTIYPRKDFIVHKRSSNAYYVGQNIDFNLWKRSRRSTRLKLALGNFQSSVEAVPERHVSSQEKTIILAALDRAAKKVGRNAA